eukprot:2000848-Rhodomonas_salina.2
MHAVDGGEEGAASDLACHVRDSHDVAAEHRDRRVRFNTPTRIDVSARHRHDVCGDQRLEEAVGSERLELGAPRADELELRRDASEQLWLLERLRDLSGSRARAVLSQRRRSVSGTHEQEGRHATAEPKEEEGST